MGPLLEDASGTTIGVEIALAANPEFQRDGTTVVDFLEPDKPIFGCDDGAALDTLYAVYERILQHPIRL